MRLVRAVVNWVFILTAPMWITIWGFHMIWHFATDELSNDERTGKKWAWK